MGLAREALIRTGYFQPSEVGDDIAPRITELYSALTRPKLEIAPPGRQIGDPLADFIHEIRMLRIEQAHRNGDATPAELRDWYAKARSRETARVLEENGY